MPNNVSKPHDRFVRHMMSDLELAGEFFRLFLEPPVLDALDLDRLDHAKESYVDDDMSELVTDLLFTAPFQGAESFLSLLIEHKAEGSVSGSAQTLPFQLHAQEVAIMAEGRRNSGSYPQVLPIGLYHGNKPYRGPMCVADNMEPPQHFIANRWREPMILIDLALYDDEDLLAGGKLGIFLLVLKYIYNPNLLTILKKLIPHMQQVEKLRGGAEFLVTTFRYLYEAGRIENKEALDQIAVKSFSKETGGYMMTIADQIREEAREEYQKSFRAYKKEIADALKARGITLEEIGGDRDLLPAPNTSGNRATN